VNYAASADSSSSSAEYFSDFQSLKKVLHWRELLSISSRVFNIRFSMGNESLNHDIYSTCVPIFVSTCAKIFILSLIVVRFSFIHISSPCYEIPISLQLLTAFEIINRRRGTCQNYAMHTLLNLIY
jgi:hypothetical protein